MINITLPAPGAPIPDSREVLGCSCLLDVFFFSHHSFPNLVPSRDSRSRSLSVSFSWPLLGKFLNPIYTGDISPSPLLSVYIHTIHPHTSLQQLSCYIVEEVSFLAFARHEHHVHALE